MTIGMLSLLIGCRTKLIMPENPTAPWYYTMDLNNTLDFRNPNIPDKSTHLRATVEVKSEVVNRDDSLSLAVTFVDVETETTDGWVPHTLTGASFKVRSFPWGELLTIDGWTTIPSEEAQWLDFIAGALFPNPPRRKSQQWDNRLLAWPYFLPQVDHSKQLVMADWQNPEKGEWHYEGTYYGKIIRTELFTGSASGSVTAAGTWMDTHTFQWTREMMQPIEVNQQIEGRIERK